MTTPEVDKKTQVKTSHDHANLSGTLTAVFGLGLVLIIVWVSVYFLFLDRIG